LNMAMGSEQGSLPKALGEAMDGGEACSVCPHVAESSQELEETILLGLRCSAYLAGHPAGQDTEQFLLPSGERVTASIDCLRAVWAPEADAPPPKPIV